MTCSAATMTPDMAYSPAAVSFRNWNKSWQIPAITNQSVRKVQFLMTEELLIEIEFEANEDQPDWLVGWMQKASQLLNFPPNWDTYRSEPIKPDAIVGAINFLLTNAQDLSIPSALPISQPRRRDLGQSHVVILDVRGLAAYEFENH